MGRADRKRNQETTAAENRRLAALERLLTYAALEANAAGASFVSYCVDLARESVHAELSARDMAVGQGRYDRRPEIRAAS